MTPEEREQHEECNAVFREVYYHMLNVRDEGSEHQRSAAAAILYVLSYYESGRAPEILGAIAEFAHNQIPAAERAALPSQTVQTA